MKSKRFFSLILALLVFGTRVGFALNIHYCDQEIASISLANNPIDCGMQGETRNQGEGIKVSKSLCCKDQVTLFQNHEPQKTDTVTKIECVTEKLFAVSIASVELEAFLMPSIKTNWGPPPRSKKNLFTLYHSFIFYG